jgi:hypothetical protein
MNSALPSLSDINVFDSLDERSAAEHFHGKDLRQAEDLFRDNFLCYQEDLMWMGPRAFYYYVQAAIAYLLGPDADGDSDAANSFCGVVEFQLEHSCDAIRPAHPLLRDAIRAILNNFSRFDCDPKTYGDVASRYRALEDQLAA